MSGLSPLGALAPSELRCSYSSTSAEVEAPYRQLNHKGQCSKTTDCYADYEPNAKPSLVSALVSS
ncbi:uncharacterized protein PgNI_02041 [Pyricularia grisea]|uniref:Uncharacterized protein n=1 Tax=Pyricularia grisea TaxID=148305 RepID=A0A6P8BGC6_PYRGI|nr:uncharacterized protein PgNI_02041 [Pyricularia grisea]TLD15669.1 hypothetical protein PgNI_02041 [Pyricularia grisea]